MLVETRTALLHELRANARSDAPGREHRTAAHGDHRRRRRTRRELPRVRLGVVESGPERAHRGRAPRSRRRSSSTSRGRSPGSSGSSRRASCARTRRHDREDERAERGRDVGRARPARTSASCSSSSARAPRRGARSSRRSRCCTQQDGTLKTARHAVNCSAVRALVRSRASIRSTTRGSRAVAGVERRSRAEPRHAPGARSLRRPPRPRARRQRVCCRSSTARPTPTRSGSQRFRDAGVSGVSFSATADFHPYGLAAPAWLAEDRYDWSELDRRARAALAGFPEAMLLLRVHLCSPPWWDEAHRGELVVWDGDRTATTTSSTATGSGPCASWSSRAWRERPRAEPRDAARARARAGLGQERRRRPRRGRQHGGVVPGRDDGGAAPRLLGAARATRSGAWLAAKGWGVRDRRAGGGSKRRPRPRRSPPPERRRPERSHSATRRRTRGRWTSTSSSRDEAASFIGELCGVVHEASGGRLVRRSVLRLPHRDGVPRRRRPPRRTPRARARPSRRAHRLPREPRARTRAATSGRRDPVDAADPRRGHGGREGGLPRERRADARALRRRGLRVDRARVRRPTSAQAREAGFALAHGAGPLVVRHERAPSTTTRRRSRRSRASAALAARPRPRARAGARSRS